MKDTILTYLMNLLFVGFVFICCSSGGVSTRIAMTYLFVFYLGRLFESVPSGSDWIGTLEEYKDRDKERKMRQKGTYFGLISVFIFAVISTS